MPLPLLLTTAVKWSDLGHTCKSPTLHKAWTRRVTDEFWALGHANMITLSAEHGRGIYELHDAISERLPEPAELIADDEEGATDELRIAVIGRLDYDTYSKLCDPLISCFDNEEAQGHLITGLGFHKHYFDYFRSQNAAEQKVAPKSRTTLCNPYIRWMCDYRAAVVCFKRVTQNGLTTSVTEETRTWEFSEDLDRWQLVHFHVRRGA